MKIAIRWFESNPDTKQAIANLAIACFVYNFGMKSLTPSQEHFAINLGGKWLWFKFQADIGKAWMYVWDVPIEISPMLFWAAFATHYLKK